MNDILTFYEVQSCKLSVDRVSNFSLFPLELCYISDTLREWFEYIPKITKGDDLIPQLSDDICLSVFLDILMQQFKVIQEAFPEIVIYLDKFESESESEDDEVFETDQRQESTTKISYISEVCTKILIMINDLSHSDL